MVGISGARSVTHSFGAFEKVRKYLFKNIFQNLTSYTCLTLFSLFSYYEIQKENSESSRDAVEK